MRRIVFVLFFHFLAVSVRAQTCSTSPEGPCLPADLESRRRPIMEAIRTGLGAESVMRQNIRLRDFAAVMGDDESQLTSWTAARSAEVQMRRSFDLAIRLTVDAYRLSPNVPAKPLVAPPKDPEGRWAAGLDAPWSATFALPQHRTLQGNDGKPHHLNDAPSAVPGQVVAGLTDPDGKSFIYLPAMAWSSFADHPGLLASAIHHEAQHYTDLVTTGWDTHENGEIRANEASLATLDLFVPETSPDGKLRIRRTMSLALKEAIESDRSAIDAGMTHSPFPTPQQEADSAAKERAESSLAEEFIALQDRVRKRGEADRDRLAAARRDARWSQFRLWTLYACEYMDGVHAGDPEWGVPDRIRARDEFLRGYLQSHLVVMDRAEIDEGLSRGDLYRAGSLGSCQRSMVTMLQELPGPADGDWLLKQLEFEKHGGRAGEIISGLIDSVRKAVVDGTAGLIRTTTAPFTAERGTGAGEPDHPRDEDPTSGDRPSLTPDIDKLPWQQLRGISAHGW